MLKAVNKFPLLYDRIFATYPRVMQKKLLFCPFYFSLFQIFSNVDIIFFCTLFIHVNTVILHFIFHLRISFFEHSVHICEYTCEYMCVCVDIFKSNIFTIKPTCFKTKAELKLKQS